MKTMIYTNDIKVNPAVSKLIKRPETGLKICFENPAKFSGRHPKKTAGAKIESKNIFK
jgi:hypothetical protein